MRLAVSVCLAAPPAMPGQAAVEASRAALLRGSLLLAACGGRFGLGGAGWAPGRAARYGARVGVGLGHRLGGGLGDGSVGRGEGDDLGDDDGRNAAVDIGGPRACHGLLRGAACARLDDGRGLSRCGCARDTCQLPC